MQIWDDIDFSVAWKLTEPPNSIPTIPTPSYSQAAAKATYRRRPRARNRDSVDRGGFADLFPPLPSGPPPPHAHHHHHQQQLYRPHHYHPHELPLGILEITNHSHSQSQPQPVFQASHPIKMEIDFEKTTVKAFLDWSDGKTDCLPPNVASELGLDLWQYHLCGKPPPTAAQETQLRLRILQLANESPFKLHQAIEQKRLKSILGSGFEWIECPIVW